MDMRALHDLKEMLCKELDKIAMKGELTAGGLETAHKLTDTIKNIDKIMMLEEDGEYSESRHRDSMGRYTRADGMMHHEPYDEYGSSYKRHYVKGHYSREDGKDRMLHELGEMMEDANEHERRILERAMQEIRKA